MDENIFELKKEHIKMIQKMYVIWDDCEFGAPAIDPKRPYGSQDVAIDIAEAIGLNVFIDAYGEKHLTHYQDDFCNKLHAEMETALQIILRCKTFEPGIYAHPKWEYTNWHKVAQ